MISHPSHFRPAFRYSRTNTTVDTIITHAETCIQRSAVLNWPCVSARINASSKPAENATAKAKTENARFARAVRSFHQTMNWRHASVRHAPPPTDQMTVTQLIAANIFGYTMAAPREKPLNVLPRLLL